MAPSASVNAAAVDRHQRCQRAALEAGLTDSAHLSCTYRSILGFQPSIMLRRCAELSVFLDGAEHDRHLAEDWFTRYEYVH